MTRARRHKVSAWLGLVAILLMFLAPVISQSLRLQHVTTAHASAHHHEDGAAPATHAVHDPAPASHHDPAQIGHACDYCTLLAHCPLLGSHADHACYLQAAAPSLVIVELPAGYGIAPVFPNALSRAPPSAAWNAIQA